MGHTGNGYGNRPGCLCLKAIKNNMSKVVTFDVFPSPKGPIEASVLGCSRSDHPAWLAYVPQVQSDPSMLA